MTLKEKVTISPWRYLNMIEYKKLDNEINNLRVFQHFYRNILHKSLKKLEEEIT